MRYIKKISIEQLDKVPETRALLDYIDAERNPRNSQTQPIHPSFDRMKSDNGKNTRNGLLKQLIKEQYGLCCFCQEDLRTKHLIEHLLPQSIFKNEEVDYYNLFLCCKDKQGQCSDAKGDLLIGKFLTHQKCESFFKYNWSGEILPNCNQNTWGDCKNNLASLNESQLQAYITIEILRLNKNSLITRRYEELQKNDFRGNLKNNKSNLQWLNSEKSKYEPSNGITILPEFSSMFLYFINEQIQKIR